MRARVIAGLIVPLGYLAGHIVAGAAAHPGGHGGRHALAELAGVAVGDLFHSLTAAALPLALLGVVLAWLTGMQGRRLQLAPTELAAVLMASFAVLKVVEHASHGVSIGEALADPVLWVGVLSQAGFAYVASRVLQRICEAGARFAACRDRAFGTRGDDRWPPRRDRLRTVPVFGLLPARGPPTVLLVTT